MCSKVEDELKFQKEFNMTLLHQIKEVLGQLVNVTNLIKGSLINEVSFPNFFYIFNINLNLP